MGYIRFAHFAAAQLFIVAFVYRIYRGIVGNQHARRRRLRERLGNVGRIEGVACVDHALVDQRHHDRELEAEHVLGRHGSCDRERAVARTLGTGVCRGP